MSAPRVSVVRQYWVGLAAVGAGLIHLALVIGAVLPVGIALAVIGIAEFGWGTLTLFDASFLAPRLAIGAALVPVALWIAALLFGGPSLPTVPLVAATLLDIAVAVVLAVSLRRPASTGTTSTGRLVAAVLLGALVVAGVTVPALLATRVEQSALDPRFTGNQHH